MKSDFELLFPNDISDEAAVALGNFLFDLANACDSRYYVQHRRYAQAQHKEELFDPERPWISAPKKAASRRTKKAKQI